MRTHLSLPLTLPLTQSQTALQIPFDIRNTTVPHRFTTQSSPCQAIQVPPQVGLTSYTAVMLAQRAPTVAKLCSKPYPLT